MKKLNVLLIVSLLAAALLAANPPGKLVRLEVINGSGDTVYMRLTGRNTGAFYYLTIPAAWDKTFTVLVDSYKRTTWACGGIVSSGSLNMTGNVKLKFVLCGKYPTRWYAVDTDGDGIKDLGLFQAPNYGEPTQEKVVYWSGYLNYVWVKLFHFTVTDGLGWWNSFNVWVRVHLTYSVWQRIRFPRGKFMRYRY
jgi:hypothetical protein